MSAPDVGATTQGYVDNQISALGNIYYTETEIDSKINDINESISKKSDSSHSHDDKYYTETEIDNKVSELNTAINKKSDDTHNHNNDYSTIGHKHTVSEFTDINSNYYNQTQIDSKINTINNAIDNKSDSDHTHKYAGSSSVGGSADSAVKLNSSAGSETHPVYFKDGKPVQTTYELNKTVPVDAEFTDTIYTHPTYDSKASGLYKITVDPTGHVSATTVVQKSDITNLGIPAQDTTYTLDSFGINASATELNYVDGVTSGIQGQLDSKVSATRKINNKPLTSDITITAADIGALTESDVATVKSEVKNYTDQQIANLLNNSTEAVDSIYELRDAMEDNADAIESLVAISGNKANASDLTEHVNNKNNPHNVTKEQLGLFVSIWVGTKAEKDALPTIEDDCLYIVTDDNAEIQWEDLSNKVTELNNGVTHDQYPSALAVWNILSNLNQYEKIANKVTIIDANSTDEQFPSAKAVYEGCFTVANQVAQEAEKLSNKTTSITTSSTDTQYPSAKAVNTFVSSSVNNAKNTILQTVGTKVTTISDSSTDTEYPTAKAVNTVIKNKVDAVIPELQESINTGLTNVVRTTESATMQAKFVAQSNSDYMVRQVRNIIISESEPSVDDMEDGDICIVI